MVFLLLETWTIWAWFGVKYILSCLAEGRRKPWAYNFYKADDAISSHFQAKSLKPLHWNPAKTVKAQNPRPNLAAIAIALFPRPPVASKWLKKVIRAVKQNTRRAVRVLRNTGTIITFLCHFRMPLTRTPPPTPFPLMTCMITMWACGPNHATNASSTVFRISWTSQKWTCLRKLKCTAFVVRNGNYPSCGWSLDSKFLSE